MKIFVYGTLKRGFERNDVLVDSTFLGKARTKANYTLYDLGDFPAMVEGGSTAVSGEIYDVDRATLKELDDIEGAPDFYYRKKIKLSNNSTAYSYLLPEEFLEDFPTKIISSGNYGSGLKVKVIQALNEEVGAGTVRMPELVRKALGVSIGGVITITGPKGQIKRKILPGLVTDINKYVIRLDGKDRDAIGVRLNQSISFPSEIGDTSTLLLFSYGSNHPKQLNDRLGHPVDGVAAYLPNYKLGFAGYSRKWQGGVAVVIPSSGDEVCGYVAQVKEKDLRTLDVFEGVPDFYYRKTLPVMVETPDGDFEEQQAVVYYPGPERQDPHPPSQSYLNAVEKTIFGFWDRDSECADYLEQAVEDSDV